MFCRQLPARLLLRRRCRRLRVWRLSLCRKRHTRPANRRQRRRPSEQGRQGRQGRRASAIAACPRGRHSPLPPLNHSRRIPGTAINLSGSSHKIASNRRLRRVTYGGGSAPGCPCGTQLSFFDSSSPERESEQNTSESRRRGEQQNRGAAEQVSRRRAKKRAEDERKYEQKTSGTRAESTIKVRQK